MTALREVLRTVEHVDTDASGVMHFSRYASLMETAALESLESVGFGIESLGAQGLDLAVAELRLKYSSPARYRDPLRIRVGVEHVGAAVCRMTGSVHRIEQVDELGTLLCAGSLVLCVMRRADDTAAALPAEMRQVLRACIAGGNDD